MSYITGEAYFCGHRFFVDERVLIPRSPIAEMIHNQMQPWIDMKNIRRVLEIGTGSGCIALSMAIEFPEIEVVASDISAPALEVARKNREDKNLVDKVAQSQPKKGIRNAKPF